MTQPLDWFSIVTRLKAVSQAGKAFAKDDYELKRHQEIEGICAEILAHHSDLDIQAVQYLLQQDTGYPTPKVDARGVCFRDGKVLMVKEIADGGWTLPGGWCDTGLTASQNVVREVWEESGFACRAVRLLAVYDRDTQGHTPPYPFSIYKLFYECEITGGSPKTSNETSEIGFFGPNEIPPLSPGRTLEHELELFFRMAKDPTIPVDFD